MFQQQQPPPTQQQQQQMQQQQQQQRKEPPQYISAEMQAREKLSHFVYEYLVHMGAAKTADMFKNEVLAPHANSNNANLQIDLSAPPGFLTNWFSVFWDLYSAHPDKREKAEASNEAKAYHKMIFPPCGFPPEGLVNGGMYGPPGFPNPNMGPMGVGPPPQPQNMPDGMFPGAYFNGPQRGGGPQPGPSQSNQASPIPGGPNRYMPQPGTRSGAPTPSSVMGPGNSFPPGAHAPPQMNPMGMSEQQMRLAIAHQQQQRQAAQQQGRLPMNLPPAGPRAIRPQFSNQYMDSPSGTPPFSGNPLAPHNGTGSVGSGGSGISLMSPNVANAPVSMANSVGGPGGGGGAQMPCGEGGPGSHESAQARFMMMQGGGGGGGGVPGAMQQQFMNHHEAPGGNGTPTAGPGSASGPGMNAGASANGSESAGAGGDLISGGSSLGAAGGQPGSQLHSLLNGTGELAMEMKHSPAGHFSGGGGGGQQPSGSGGVNGGTPISGSAGPIGSVGPPGPGSVHSQHSGSSNSQQQTGGGGPQQPPITEAMELGGGGGHGLGNHQSDEISKIKANLLEGFPQTHQFQPQ